MIRVNLGGEGEVSDSINVQPGRIGGRSDLARGHADEMAQRSGQPVVRAAGNRLPFADRSVDEVVTNDVPIDFPIIGHFGPSFSSTVSLTTSVRSSIVA